MIIKRSAPDATENPDGTPVITVKMWAAERGVIGEILENEFLKRLEVLARSEVQPEFRDGLVFPTAEQGERVIEQMRQEKLL